MLSYKRNVRGGRYGDTTYTVMDGATEVGTIEHYSLRNWGMSVSWASGGHHLTATRLERLKERIEAAWAKHTSVNDFACALADDTLEAEKEAKRYAAMSTEDLLSEMPKLSGDAGRAARRALKQRTPYGDMCIYPEQCVRTRRCCSTPVCSE